MKTLKYLLLLLTVSVLTGCKSTYQLQTFQAPKAHIPPNAGILIIVPPNADDEPDSGRLAATTLQTAFATHAARVQLSAAVAPLQADLANAAAAGLTYVVEPTLHRWEEEPTEWNGKSDILDIGLRLLQSPDGAVVSAVRFGGKSKWMTFGGDHVEHLFAPLAAEWVRVLYEGGDFKLPTTTKEKTSQ